MVCMVFVLSSLVIICVVLRGGWGLCRLSFFSVVFKCGVFNVGVIGLFCRCLSVLFRRMLSLVVSFFW